jgi:general secretion pathway protein I
MIPGDLHPARGARGFSLLEVMVAVAILGLGLTAILSAQAGAFASAAHARNISVASGLVRCKMSEVEEHLGRDGFQETDETGAGPCCGTEESPNMRCAWRVEKPQFPEAKLGDLDLKAGLNLGGSSSPGGAPAGGGFGAVGLLSQMGAGSGSSSPLAGASSVGDFAKTLANANTSTPGADPASGGGGLDGLVGMGMTLVYPTLKTIFEASTRRIIATLTWREGNREYSLEVVEWYTIPQQGLTPDISALEGDEAGTPPKVKP